MEGIRNLIRARQSSLGRTTIDNLPSVSPTRSSHSDDPPLEGGSLSNSTSALPDPPIDLLAEDDSAIADGDRPGPDPALDVERIDERGHRVIVVNPPLEQDPTGSGEATVAEPRRSLWDRMWNRKGRIKLDSAQV